MQAALRLLLAAAVLASAAANRDELRRHRELLKGKTKAEALSRMVIGADGHAAQEKELEAATTVSQKPGGTESVVSNEETATGGKGATQELPKTVVNEPAEDQGVVNKVEAIQYDSAKAAQLADVKRHIDQALAPLPEGEIGWDALAPILKKLGYGGTKELLLEGMVGKLTKEEAKIRLNRFVDGLAQYPMAGIDLPQAFMEFTASQGDLVNIKDLEAALREIGTGEDEINEIITAARTRGGGTSSEFNYKKFVTFYDKDGLKREGPSEAETPAA